MSESPNPQSPVQIPYRQFQCPIPIPNPHYQSPISNSNPQSKKYKKGLNCGQIKNKRWDCTFTQSIMQFKSFCRCSSHVYFASCCVCILVFLHFVAIVFCFNFISFCILFSTKKGLSKNIPSSFVMLVR